MKKLYWFLKFCFYVTVVAIIAAGAVVTGVFWHFSKDLPKLDSLKDYAPPVVSEVFASDGTKIGEFWEERRIVLKPDEIPDLVKKAIIASEDDRFMEHSGIDYLGIVRAMFENLKAGHIVQGGSTISQQVVKTFVLTREKKYERKVKEAILAKRLEDKFSKSEILYLYLNQVYFGNRAYGIEAAAENYFHRTAKELSVAQAAMIAGLVKAPSSSSPTISFQAAKDRQAYVLGRMLDKEFINESQYQKALIEPLSIYNAPVDKEFNQRYAPWYVEEVRRQLLEKYGTEVVYKHGLHIETAIDLKAQHAADRAVARGLSELSKRHGYHGPVKHLSESEFSAFNSANHDKIYKNSLTQDLMLTQAPEQIAKQPITLKSDQLYQALVTAVDGTSKTISVDVGGVTGTIVLRDFGWARDFNENTHGYDGAIYIQTPVGHFNVGDVILVKPLEVDPKNIKTYPNADSTNYFTLEDTPKIEGSLFSYDPQTGYVRAIVGGKDFRSSEFNRATQAERQTGSVFKPMLYAAALDKGYTQETVIEDSPVRIPDGPGKFWTPQNYGGGYKGPMTLRSALQWSRNVVSVKIILDIGTHYVTGVVRKLGITTPIDKVYSMALGSNTMKLAEVARAFGTFPNGGWLPDLIYVKKITDRFGSTLEENKPKMVKPFTEQLKTGSLSAPPAAAFNPDTVDNYLREDLIADADQWIKKDKLNLTPYEKILLYGKQIPEGYVMNPKTAYSMVDMMQNIVNAGTGTRAKLKDRPTAGKTGTTNDLTDCWFVGYVPDHVTGVWTGYDDISHKIGLGEAGGLAAAPIFKYYMEEFLAGTPVKNFDAPPEVNDAALKSPVDKTPGANLNELLGTPNHNNGGADIFINDI